MDTATLYTILIRLLRLACQRNAAQSFLYQNLRTALDCLEDTTDTPRTYPSRAARRAQHHDRAGASQ